MTDETKDTTKSWDDVETVETPKKDPILTKSDKIRGIGDIFIGVGNAIANMGQSLKERAATADDQPTAD